MLRNRSSPRRKARSRVIGSPRYRRTAYSVMEPVTMLTRIAEMTNVAAPEGRRSAAAGGPAGGTTGAAGTTEPRRVPQFTQNVFVAAFAVPQAGHAIEADKRATPAGHLAAK